MTPEVIESVAEGVKRDVILALSAKVPGGFEVAVYGEEFEVPDAADPDAKPWVSFRPKERVITIRVPINTDPA